ncbi:MAG: IMP cyclohydrolase [Acidobacteriota bacterium]|nr:IMP cyclohydrolase [Acidobacteriota bacterium]
MNSPWESLMRMLYPGRLLILGGDAAGANHVLIYAITGRSPSSQARMLEVEGNAIWTKPTDPETLKKGNPELLVYPAVIFGRGIAVSNGRQTVDVDAETAGSAVAGLDAGLGPWTYEPDAPIYTPRITGCILPNGRAALSIIKRGPDGLPFRAFYDLPDRPGWGFMLATYAGDNREPLQAFSGEPLEIGLEGATPEETAEAAYTALHPEGRSNDFRVALVCVYARRGALQERRIAVINRHERNPL